MLQHLKKYFTTQVDNTAQATTEEVTSMTTEKDQALLATDTTTAELTAQLSTVTEALTTLQASFADLSTKYAAAEAALAASAEAQAMLVAQAAATKMEARTASLSAILGDAKGVETATLLSSLDDAAFEAVRASYAANFQAEAESEMFQEKGISAEAVAPVEKDAAARLAESFAKQFAQK